jgi:hypothetical protein
MRLHSFNFKKYRPKTKKNSQKCAAEKQVVMARGIVAYKPQDQAKIRWTCRERYGNMAVVDQNIPPKALVPPPLQLKLIPVHCES